MKRNAVYTALLTIASLLIITAVLFTSLQFCMNQRDWYYKTYVKYNTDKHTMMSKEDMTEAIFRLVDYMEGRVDSIQLSVTEAGRVVEMYNRQEIDHMVDVRAVSGMARRAHIRRHTCRNNNRRMHADASQGAKDRHALPRLFDSGGCIRRGAYSAGHMGGG